MNLFPNATPAPSSTVVKERRQLGLLALAVSFIFLFSIPVQWCTVWLVQRFAPSLADRDWYIWVRSFLPMYLFSMPLSLFFFRACSRERPQKHRFSFPIWLGLLAICIALSYFGSLLGTVFNLLLNQLFGFAPSYALPEMTRNSPLWVNLLFCGILAPAMEEIFYRKLLIDRLLRYGELPAVLISGILFGLIHGNLNQFFYAALIGVLFGYVYLRTGNIFCTMSLHMAVNLFGGVLSTELYRRLNTEALLAGDWNALLADRALPVLATVYLTILVGSFVAAPVASALLWKKITFRKAEPSMCRNDWLRAAGLNPAVWLLVCVIALLFLV